MHLRRPGTDPTRNSNMDVSKQRRWDELALLTAIFQLNQRNKILARRKTNIPRRAWKPA
jgi:hypothetical protein